MAFSWWPFLVATGTKAQAQTVDDIGVSVAVKGASDGLAHWKVTLRNGSQKTITAWAWSSEGRYGRRLNQVSLREPGGRDQRPAGPDKDLAFRSASSPYLRRTACRWEQVATCHQRRCPLDHGGFNDDTAIGIRCRFAVFAGRKSMAAREAEDRTSGEALRTPLPRRPQSRS